MTRMLRLVGPFVTERVNPTKVDPAISVQTRTNERGIGHYLERHRDDLPSEVRIALERRRAGQYGY
jgi:hypothetical protein